MSDKMVNIYEKKQVDFVIDEDVKNSTELAQVLKKLV